MWLRQCFLTEVFDLIDPERRFTQGIAVENFVFGVHDSALNLMFLLIKKAIIRSRTYKQSNSASSLYRNILRRIISDKAVLSDKNFQQKWQNFTHLIHQSELYLNSFIL